MKKTVVFGASPNPTRYSYRAVMDLQKNGFEVVPVGIRKGTIGDTEILLGTPTVEDVHTVTLYMNPERQEPHYTYILSLRPQRLIFNPGTENPELVKIARKAGIEVDFACTLVMLSVGTY